MPCSLPETTRGGKSAVSHELSAISSELLVIGPLARGWHFTIAVAPCGHEGGVKASVAVAVALFTWLLPACGGDVVVDDPPKGADGQGGGGGTSSQSSSSTQSGSTSPDVAASSSSGVPPECGCDAICPGFVACTGCSGCPCESFSDSVRTCLCGAGNECSIVEECLPDDFLCPL